jgi:hypothetical protein
MLLNPPSMQSGFWSNLGLCRCRCCILNATAPHNTSSASRPRHHGSGGHHHVFSLPWMSHWYFVLAHKAQQPRNCAVCIWRSRRHLQMAAGACVSACECLRPRLACTLVACVCACVFVRGRQRSPLGEPPPQGVWRVLKSTRARGGKKHKNRKPLTELFAEPKKRKNVVFVIIPCIFNI